MSDVQALIADMVRAGVDADLIGRTAAALAAREPMVVEDEQAQRRRARDRERKRLRKSAESAEICGPSPEEKRKVSPCTPSKEKTQPSPDLLSLPAEAQAPVKQPRGRTLPDDWKPTEGHFAEADKLGRDMAWVLSQAERMRDWALANSNRAVAKKADWDRMFLNWLRQQHERNPLPQGRAPPSWAPVDTKAAMERAMAAKGIRT